MKSKALIVAAVAASFLLTSCAANDTAAVQSPASPALAAPSVQETKEPFSDEALANLDKNNGNIYANSSPERRQLEELRTKALTSLDSLFRYVSKIQQQRESKGAKANDDNFGQDFEAPYKMIADSVSADAKKKIVNDVVKLVKTGPSDPNVTYAYKTDMTNVKVVLVGDMYHAIIPVKDIKVEDERGKSVQLGATNGVITMETKAATQSVQWRIINTNGV